MSKSMAETSEVLPQPPWPTTATLRMLRSVVDLHGVSSLYRNRLGLLFGKPRPSRIIHRPQDRRGTGASLPGNPAAPWIYNRSVVLPFSSRVVLALDAGSVSAALVRRGLRASRVVALHSRPLPEGALVPSALARNLIDPQEVGRAIRETLESLPRTAGVTLVLPHGVSRVSVLDLPKGHEATEYARFRLAASLPYPATEAVVDFLPLERGRMLAAAVRREVVVEYEEAVASAGVVRARVDLAPLAAAAGAGPISQGFAGPTVFLVLGDAACSFLAYDGGRLLGVRSRRRGPEGGDADRLHTEALRSAAAAGLLGEPELVLAGSGARGVLDGWGAAGRGARLLPLMAEGGPLHETAARPWLAAALA